MAKTDSLVLEIVVDAKTGLPVIKNLRSELKHTGDTAKETGNSMEGMFGKLIAGAVSIAATSKAWGVLKGVISSSIGEYQQAEAVQAQLEAVIKSTGGAAGLSAKQIGNMASSLSAMTAVDDDVIKGSSAMLLTFTQIGRDVFPRAQQAVMDVSRAMGTDLQSATIQIGKALNDPIQGLSALSRVGIQFTASQEAMIKGFVKAGEAAKAQGIILNELERQFGGSAAAYAKTTAGMVDSLDVAFGNIKEKLGQGIMEGLRPAFTQLMAWIEKNQDKIEEFAINAGKKIGEIATSIKDVIVWIIKWKDELLLAGAAMAVAFSSSTIASWATALKSSGIVASIKGVFDLAHVTSWGYTAKTVISATKDSFIDLLSTSKLGVLGLVGALYSWYQSMKAIAELPEQYVAGIAAWRNTVAAFKNEVQSFNAVIVKGFADAAKEAERLAKVKGLEDFKKAVAERGERLYQAYEKEWEAEQKIVEARKKEVSAIEDVLKQFYGVKESLVDQLRAHQANAEALGITGDMAERLAAAIKDAQFRQALEAMPKAAEKTSQKLYDMIPPIQRTYDFTERLKNPLGDVAEESERITSEWEKMSDALGGASEILNGMTDLFEGVGLSGLANITNQLSGISQGAAGAFGSFASGDIIGGISQSLSTLGSVASFMSDIFGWNKSGVDDWVKQFDRLGVSISENIVEQIKEATKAGERASTVQAQLTDQIISDGEVTARNLDGYKRLVQDIFMEIDNGRITGASAVKEVGDAFAALADKAKEAGLEGNKALADLLNDARNRGLVGEDILSYVDPARQKGLDALATHIAGTSGSLAGFNAAMRQTDAFFASMVADGKDTFSILDALGPALDKLKTIGKEKGYSTGYLVNLFGMQEFLTKNQDVIASIQATQTVMESMANTGILTQDRFTEFAASTWDYYKKLTKGGKNEEQAIQALLPMLGKQLWYAEQYGFELDENTRKLIEEAKAQGLKLDAAIPAEERMAQGIEKLVELFEKLTGGVDSTTGAITRMSDAASKFKLQPYDGADYEKYFNAGGGKSIPGYATGTGGWQYPDDAWISGENGPELNLWDRRRGKINIAPLGKSGSDSYTGAVGSTQNISLGGVTLHVTNQISGGTDVLKQVENALALNINRLADKTAKAVKERLNVKR